MTSIAGGVGAAERSDTPERTDEVRVATPARPEPVTTEDRIVDALLDCIGRWGLAKTTMGDIARQAGVSRATVYRLYPGGKDQILDAGARAEVARLAELLVLELEDAEDLRGCVIGAVHTASVFLDQHEALTHLREHEPAALEQVLAFDRLDALLELVGPLLAPIFGRFVDPEHAAELSAWITRLVVSHIGAPSSSADLRHHGDVVAVVDTFVLPGVRTDSSSLPTTRST